MKKLISICLAVSMVLGLTACGSGSQKAQSSGEAGGVQKITFATWAGGEEYNEMKELVEKVNQEKGAGNGYRVELMSIPSDYYTKIQAVFAAKSADVDLMWLSQEYTPTYAELGGIVDMTEFAEKDTQIDFSNMYEGTKAAGVFNGNIYGIPWISNPVIVYYNKNLTDEAGYTQADYDKWAAGDWDVNDFYEITKSMTKDTDGDGEYDQYGTYIWDWPPLNQWLWSFGGDILDENNRPVINSPESMKAWEYIVKMFADSASALPVDGESNSGMTTFFQSGKLGMILAGVSDGIEREEGLPFEIGYAVVPKGEKGEHQAFPWIGVTSISAFSKVDQELLYQAASDLTVEFLNWKAVSPIKGQEDRYIELIPKKAGLPVEVVSKSLEIARTGNLYKYAEIGDRIWTGNNQDGIQQQIYNATTKTDYKTALENLDLQAAADKTQQAIEKVLD